MFFVVGISVSNILLVCMLLPVCDVKILVFRNLVLVHTLPSKCNRQLLDAFLFLFLSLFLFSQIFRYKLNGIHQKQKPTKMYDYRTTYTHKSVKLRGAAQIETLLLHINNNFATEWWPFFEFYNLNSRLFRILVILNNKLDLIVHFTFDLLRSKIIYEDEIANEERDE